MIIKQLSVFLENKTGRLTELTRILADNDINISAFSVADATDYGIIRMIVGRPELALEVLKKNGFSVNTTEVICIIVPHKPGGLYKALKVLSDNKIDIDYMYAFALENEASVVIRPTSVNHAVEILQKNKMVLLKASSIYQI
ncbi:MAG: ACT domain-containing protein [Bacteroidales bacterium]|nr:ACT domain-containing protein [Bacteroidales bacterium]